MLFSDGVEKIAQNSPAKTIECLADDIASHPNAVTTQLSCIEGKALQTGWHEAPYLPGYCTELSVITGRFQKRFMDFEKKESRQSDIYSSVVNVALGFKGNRSTVVEDYSFYISKANVLRCYVHTYDGKTGTNSGTLLHATDTLSPAGLYVAVKSAIQSIS